MEPKMKIRTVVPLLALMLFSASLPAADVGPKDDAFIVQSRSFLSSHPDLYGRVLGMKSYSKGDYKEAMRQFRKGAYYADKPSQAMVAEMLWKGEGVQIDRA
jgi:hypothetical protein